MKRVPSIDIFRSLTMLLMLWVNDFASMEGIPQWMLHAPTRVDMLGLSDLVFPSFLFCMGLSIPFAIERRMGKGHVLLRSLSLIALGLLELNETGTLYEFVLGIAIFFVWSTSPKSDGSRVSVVIRRILLIVGLGALAWLTRSAWPIRIGWWGILGLIGWAYLLCALLYLALRKIRFAIPVAWVLVIALAILDNCRLGFIPHYPGGWVHTGLAFSGVMCSYVSRRLSRAGNVENTGNSDSGNVENTGNGGRHTPFPIVLLGGALLMAAGFFICHIFWIISKNLGTPTWMFLCLAIDLVVLALIYYVADIKGSVSWAAPIRAAGTSTFTCYCLPFIAYPLMDWLGLWLPDTIRSGFSGLVLALVFALAIILIAELLSRIHIRLKL